MVYRGSLTGPVFGLRREIDRLFEDAFGGDSRRSGGWSPPVDIREDNKEIVLEVEHEVVIHVDEAGHVFGALDVARHPVDGIRNARKERFRVQDHAGCSCLSGARTQVSLLPPPCDEFTTSDPFRMATRVRPPGRT